MDESVNREGVVKALEASKKTPSQALDDLYNSNQKEKVANAVSNYVSKSNRALVGLEPSRRATNVKTDKVQEALNDQSTIKAVVAKRAKQDKTNPILVRDWYTKNPGELENDVALYVGDKKATFGVSIEDRTNAANTLTSQLKTAASEYGETETQRIVNISNELGINTETEMAAVRASLKGTKRTPAQNQLLGNAYLSLPATHRLKAAMGVEGDANKVLFDNLKSELSPEAIERINAGVLEGKDIGDLILIETRKK